MMEQISVSGLVLFFALFGMGIIGIAMGFWTGYLVGKAVGGNQ